MKVLESNRIVEIAVEACGHTCPKYAQDLAIKTGNLVQDALTNLNKPEEVNLLNLVEGAEEESINNTDTELDIE